MNCYVFKSYYDSYIDCMIFLTVMSEPSLPFCHGAVTDVLSEQHLWLNAAQTGSDLSPHLFLWHRPRNEKDLPTQRHGTHLQKKEINIHENLIDQKVPNKDHGYYTEYCRFIKIATSVTLLSICCLFYEGKLTACMCDLPDSQAGESYRCQESVCASVSQRERCVKHIMPCQHQSVVKEEEAHIRHMLIGPNHAYTHRHTQAQRLQIIRSFIACI